MVCRGALAGRQHHQLLVQRVRASQQRPGVQQGSPAAAMPPCLGAPGGGQAAGFGLEPVDDSSGCRRAMPRSSPWLSPPPTAPAHRRRRAPPLAPLAAQED